MAEKWLDIDTIFEERPACVSTNFARVNDKNQVPTLLTKLINTDFVTF